MVVLASTMAVLMADLMVANSAVVRDALMVVALVVYQCIV